jgi:hypothetical protein
MRQRAAATPRPPPRTCASTRCRSLRSARCTSPRPRTSSRRGGAVLHKLNPVGPIAPKPPGFSTLANLKCVFLVSPSIAFLKSNLYECHAVLTLYQSHLVQLVTPSSRCFTLRSTCAPLRRGDPGRHRDAPSGGRGDRRRLHLRAPQQRLRALRAVLQPELSQRLRHLRRGGAVQLLKSVDA